MQFKQLLLTNLIGFIASQNFLEENSEKELLMLFEVTRHGARGGLHVDPFNKTYWKRGELTNSGKRQHYLIGQQLRDNYVKTNFLSSIYNPNEVYVRSTDVNRTIESALSQMNGLFSEGSNPYLQIYANQTEETLPELNISEENFNAYQSGLGNHSLPFGFQPVHDHVFPLELDKFQPTVYCPIVEEETHRRKRDKNLEARLNYKYNTTIRKMNEALGKNLTSFGIIEYADSLYARYFDRQPLPEVFDDQFMSEIMLFYAEYYNETVAVNETIRKIFVNGMMTELVTRFVDRINLDLNQTTDNILKFFFYSDHDDSIDNLCNAFSHTLPNYPPFASQILFGLWKSNSIYYVNLTINDVQVPLQGACAGAYFCDFIKFVELIKTISFYGDEKTYNKLCDIKEETNTQTQEQQNTDDQSQVEYMNPFALIFIIYIVMMLVVTVFWVLICKYGQKKTLETQNLVNQNDQKSDQEQQPSPQTPPQPNLN